MKIMEQSLSLSSDSSGRSIQLPAQPTAVTKEILKFAPEAVTPAVSANNTPAIKQVIAAFLKARAAESKLEEDVPSRKRKRIIVDSDSDWS